MALKISPLVRGGFERTIFPSRRLSGRTSSQTTNAPAKATSPPSQHRGLPDFVTTAESGVEHPAEAQSGLLTQSRERPPTRTQRRTPSLWPRAPLMAGKSRHAEAFLPLRSNAQLAPSGSLQLHEERHHLLAQTSFCR